MTNTNASNSPRRAPVPDGLSECGLSELPSSIHSDDETEHDAFFVQTCVEEMENAEYVAPLKPLLSTRVEDPLDEELDSRSRLRGYVVKYVGHIPRNGKRFPDPSKTQAIAEWKWPDITSPKAVKGFLGLANWYSIYIPLAATRRTHSTKFSRVFAFIIVLCFRGVFEGAQRNGTIRLAQFNHFCF